MNLNNSSDFYEALNKLKGKRENILKKISDANTDIKQGKRELKRYEQAKEIIKQVGLATQQKLQYHVSDITSLALDSVFENPYEIDVEFIERRGKSECDIYFVRDWKKIDPLSSSGGGAVDVASFALRIACWSMKTPSPRPTIILDEPMRFLSSDNQEKASMMIKELSEKLGIQFIIVTHEIPLTLYADKIFKTRIRKKVTRIKEL